MVKINFQKVEEALEEAIRKITINRLLELATFASLIGGRSVQAEEVKDKPETAPGQDQVTLKILSSLQGDLQKLQESDAARFAQLGFTRNDLKKLRGNPKDLLPEDWMKIKEIKEKINEFKLEMRAQLPETDDLTVVETERKKHINKRFNIRDSWLPLK
jgi:hypothetical protein